MKDLNIVFAGTPEFAAIHLRYLIAQGANVIAAYTQPDRPAGRGKKLTASPVKQVALEYEIPVFQPVSLKPDEAQTELKSLKADVMVVVAYGLLLPKAVLDIPHYGCINVHGSILPRWRGAAPIQRAIEAGDTTSGVTIMQMDVGLDTGDMLIKSECAITAHETTLSLHDKLGELGPIALNETLHSIAEGNLTAEKQDDSLSNYAKKIEKHEALINWDEPAELIDRKIRAFNPFPICYTLLNGERIKIYQANVTQNTRSQAKPGDIVDIRDDVITVQCGDGQINIQKLQIPGKKPMQTAVFLNGYANLLHNEDNQLNTFDPITSAQ